MTIPEAPAPSPASPLAGLVGERPRRARRGLAIYFLVLVPCSGALEWILIRAGDPIENHRGAILLLMATPAFASVVARLWLREGIRDVSFRSGGREGGKALLLAWLYPLAVGFAAYGLAWITGLASFAPPEIHRTGLDGPSPAARFGGLLALNLTVGAFASSLSAAGEEIGWRGYMLTRLVDAGFRRPVLTSGLIWGAWHLPLILTGQYASSARPALSAALFLVNIVAFAYLAARPRVGQCLAGRPASWLLEHIDSGSLRPLDHRRHAASRRVGISGRRLRCPFRGPSGSGDLAGSEKSGRGPDASAGPLPVNGLPRRAGAAAGCRIRKADRRPPMAKPASAVKPRMSDEAVQAKTGKTWEQWQAALDRAGAATLTHPQIVAHLKGEFRLTDWWCQMVAVAYEQARGLRDKHEKPTGYEIGVSKTIAAPLSRLFRAWEDRKIRDKWLEDPGFVIRKATPGKSMRITWVDGTNVDAGFYAKGDGKSQISVQHGRLESAREAARLKTYWSAQLGKLKEMLEG